MKNVDLRTKVINKFLLKNKIEATRINFIFDCFFSTALGKFEVNHLKNF